MLESNSDPRQVFAPTLIRLSCVLSVSEAGIRRGLKLQKIWPIPTYPTDYKVGMCHIGAAVNRTDTVDVTTCKDDSSSVVSFEQSSVPQSFFMDNKAKNCRCWKCVSSSNEGMHHPNIASGLLVGESNHKYGILSRQRPFRIWFGTLRH